MAVAFNRALGSMLVHETDSELTLQICSEPSQNFGRTLDRMCGIVGYVGPRPSQDILLAGLARLEYRGYDSAGVAVIDGDGNLGMRKKAGKLSLLRDSLADEPLADGTTGIGHTRWATHGGPT